MRLRTGRRPPPPASVLVAVAPAATAPRGAPPAAAAAPAIVIVVIMRTMIALSAFAAIFAATGGGPGTATEILNLYAYRTSFTEFNLGYGAALASASVLVLAASVVIKAFQGLMALLSAA